MPTLIKDGQVIDNPWQLIEKETAISTVLADACNHLLIPLSLWQEHKTNLVESDKAVGIWLDSDDDPYALTKDISIFSLIAVNFPVFKDGRGFSTAAILRGRIEYQRELRAIGDVLRDQLFYMKKCGINSFEFNGEVKLEDALTAFNDFSTSYQSTVEDPLPLFRRR